MNALFHRLDRAARRLGSQLQTEWGEVVDFYRSQRWKRRVLEQWLGAVAGGLLVAALAILLRAHWTEAVPLGQTLLLRSYDLPFALQPQENPTDALLILMDEESHRALDQPYGAPWDRALHARLIDTLTTAGARLVVMDVLFSEPGTPAANRLLADAMKRSGKVVIGADYVFTGIPGAARGSTVVYPVPDFRDAAAGIGIVQLLKEADYGIREHFPGGYEGVDFVPSLPWKAAELAGATVTGDPQRRTESRWIRYYGPPGSLPSLSYHLALIPNSPAAEMIRDRVVFVGQSPTAGFTLDERDEFRSPYSWLTKTFLGGVEVQATCFLNLLHGDWLHRMHWGLELLVLIGCGLGFGFGLALVRPFWATALAGLGAFLVMAGVWWLFTRYRLWFGWLLIVGVQVPAAWLWSLVLNSHRLYAEKKTLEQSLALHLSPARVKQIAKRPDLLRPGADLQEISILFSDIANFSRITSRMDPADLFKMLNKYFDVALGCIHATDGTVIKLAGDSIFAIWNAPFVQPDQQDRACRAALRLCEALVRFDLNQQNLPLHTRVGLHTGLAHVGNLGSAQRFDYTAIGDCVNVASRLEGLNKLLGTQILATRDIQKIVQHSLLNRPVGYFRLKGIDRVIEVHELLGGLELEAETRPWRDVFAAALHAFERRDFAAAARQLERTLELRPQDGPSRFYLDRLAHLRTVTLPDDWAGEIEVREK